MSYTSTGALLSSKDQTWTTPPALFDQLNEEFHFTRDIASSPDTAIWQDVILRSARDVRFIRGRLRFGGGEMPAPFPSAIVVFSNASPYGYDYQFRPGKEPCTPSFWTFTPGRA